ncbi:MAG: SAM-dependent chlorinase/fluorinase, partial [Bradymonadaceae bacterium]
VLKNAYPDFPEGSVHIVGVDPDLEEGKAHLIARFQGHADTAKNRYRRYGEIARESHLLTEVATSHLNLAQVELMSGRFEAAERQLREAERRYEQLSRESEKTDLRKLARIVLGAGRGEWSRVDEIFGAYADGWPEGAALEKDHPWLLEMAGDYAAEAGEDEWARQTWQLARDLWADLEDEAAVGRVLDKIDRI